jgi:hypothetical protein
MKNNTHELFRSLVRDFFELNISSDSFSELREIAISEANASLSKLSFNYDSDEEADESEKRLLIIANLVDKFIDSDTWATTKPEYLKALSRGNNS